MLPNATDVLIVGAGPTGLALAAKLAIAGVDFVLVDRLPEGANTSRAAVVHARTLEVLEELGVSEELVRHGIKVPCFTVRDRDRRLLTIRFDRLPTRYPYALMIPQYQTEAILLDRLRALGRGVFRPCRVVDLRQEAEGVEVTVAADGAAAEQVRARYVVGADGMHSLVRERAGIGFVGDTYEQSFVLADVRLRCTLDGEEVRLFFSPDGLVVVVPLPGGLHRIVATLDSAPENPTLGDVQQLLDTRGPITSVARIDTIIWSSRFRVHHRIADGYRAGRMLLAGDAAHVHSPAGGQGMNIGIQDALALGNALHAVVSGARDEAALEEYEQSRRPIARRVVELTDRMTRVATLAGRHKRALRNFVIRILDRIPAFRRSLAMDLAELHNR